jgi:catechol-2,3-dioxygenase|tara:strand:- start:995 stop:1390 length:396 start_codon:yes stop_codon:yes gene_type:complete
MALGHIGINIFNFEVSRSYYALLMPLVGYELFINHDDQFAYRPSGNKIGAYLFFYEAEAPGFDQQMVGLQHLAFMMPSRESVTSLHKSVSDMNSQIVHSPREWPEYPPPYYAFFWKDPNEIMLEAVCHKNS